jgi:hypothetical protein
MNTDSGIVNTDSGDPGKVFMINRNYRSRSSGIDVHVPSETPFTIARNTQKWPGKVFWIDVC